MVKGLAPPGSGQESGSTRDTILLRVNYPSDFRRVTPHSLPIHFNLFLNLGEFPPASASTRNRLSYRERPKMSAPDVKRTHSVCHVILMFQLCLFNINSLLAQLPVSQRY